MATWIQVLWPVSVFVLFFGGVFIGHSKGYSKGRKDGDKYGEAQK